MRTFVRVTATRPKHRNRMGMYTSNHHSGQTARSDQYVNHLFFYSGFNTSFSYFNLACLMAVSHICIKKTPSSRQITKKKKPAFISTKDQFEPPPPFLTFLNRQTDQDLGEILS